MEASKIISISDEEKKQIKRKYRELLTSWDESGDRGEETNALVRKAFNLAYGAHENMRRRSGEPYIYHPLEVAIICTKEIGLGTTSIICALLHDVVEDTDYTIANIKVMFGERVAAIIDGLTKIKELFDNENGDVNAVYHKKIIITLADDVRVILIKLADRLHNMRTLTSMPPHKQVKISKETFALYTPLAHRLGLYAIKSELEDLSLKFTEPQIYESISQKLEEALKSHRSNIRKFILEIKKKVASSGYSFEIIERAKSIFSIWEKMKKKQLPFEEIYDIFAIRIIVDSERDDERRTCWDIYSLVTECYSPKPDRLRDWVSSPKANGYQALHTTVMSQFGNWVEVQIRTKRMDEVAEKGYAAHWKYKEVNNNESNLEHWLDRIRDMLQNPDSNAMDFMDNFRGYLFTQEVFVFTPNGEQRLFPIGSTVLDFAYGIHSDIGKQCIGANVNHNLKPRNYILKNGDQVNILTSKAQLPRDEWLDNVVTTRAKSSIKQQLKDIKRPYQEEGEKKLQEILKKLNIKSSNKNIEHLVIANDYKTRFDLMYDVAFGKIGLQEVRMTFEIEDTKWYSRFNPFSRNKQETLEDFSISEARNKKTEELVLNEQELNRINLAECCHPVHGDDVVGFANKEKGITIHRTICENAKKLKRENKNDIIKIRWNEKSSIDFMAGLYFEGIDRKGLVHEITGVISEEGDTNMKYLLIRAEDTICEGEIIMYVSDYKKLEMLIKNIKKIEGIKRLYRVNRNKQHNRSISHK